MSGGAEQRGRAFVRAGHAAPQRWIAAALMVLAAFAAFSPDRAAAQGPGSFSSSYIRPFPETDRYHAYVLGDWLASGLASSLEEAFKQEGAVKFISDIRSSAGLTRNYDWAAEANRMVKSGPVHIVIIMMGVNDARSIRVGNTRYRPGSPEWRDAYAAEAEKLIKAFRSANVAVYWVGLPAMGSGTLSEAVEAMNDAVRQAAYLNGAKFIDTWSGFTDQAGNYTAYGPDLTGQTKRLRGSDGLGFTAAGSRKLAYYVEIVLKRDLDIARQQRNIPLAGDEEEQERVVPKVARAEKPNGDNSDEPAAGEEGDGQQSAEAGAAADGRQQEAALVPAPLPGRQDQAAFAAALAPQDMIFGDLDSGLTSIAVISPLSDVSLRDAQRRIPLSERLYFRVLSKGEALPPKEGRADDFTWEQRETQGNGQEKEEAKKSE